MDDADIILAWRLGRASWGGELVEVDGVTFDLRSPELPRAEWQPQLSLGSDRARARGLDFPRSFVSATGVMVELVAGDAVRIGYVVREIRANALHPFEHEADVEVRLACLVVERPNYERIQVAEPLSFHRLGAILDAPASPGDYVGIRQRLSERLALLMGVRDPDDLAPDSRYDTSRPYLAEALNSFRAAEAGVEGAEAAFGFYLALVEAMERLHPPASERSQGRAKQAAGAAHARLSRQRDWRPRAAAMFALDSTLTAYALAKRIHAENVSLAEQGRLSRQLIGSEKSIYQSLTTAGIGLMRTAQSLPD